MATLDKKITLERASKVLFVEGYSDLRFYAEMLEHLGFQEGEVFIEDLGTRNRTRLEERARALLKPNVVTHKTHVAVIFDADSDAQAAFQSARDALKTVFQVEIFRHEQWIGGQEGSTKFGVYVAGTGSEKPELESLAWEAWSLDVSNTALKQCVESFIQCSTCTNLRLKSPDKVRVSAALAVLNEDDPRLGPGTRAKHFDLDSPVFEPLRVFLSGMKPEDAP